MENNRNKLTCDEIRQWDMVAYLAKLGYQAARVRKHDHWYLSPLRSESIASFKINKRLNRWYDHGLGKGGNLVDFCLLYHQCTVSKLLQMLSGDFSFQQHKVPVISKENGGDEIKIQWARPISSQPLIVYLMHRKISVGIAARYCQEIHYSVGEKSYYALGLKNDDGGYELRSPYFKGSSSPKAITSISKGSGVVTVFEGMFDFLSYVTFFEDMRTHDYVILNSLALFEKARPFMEQHDWICLYLDRDTAGQNCSLCAASYSPKYHDSSAGYKDYKDINQWLVAEGNGGKFKWFQDDFDKGFETQDGA